MWEGISKIIAAIAAVFVREVWQRMMFTPPLQLQLMPTSTMAPEIQRHDADDIIITLSLNCRFDNSDSSQGVVTGLRLRLIEKTWLGKRIVKTTPLFCRMTYKSMGVKLTEGITVPARTIVNDYWISGVIELDKNEAPRFRTHKHRFYVELAVSALNQRDHILRLHTPWSDRGELTPVQIK